MNQEKVTINIKRLKNVQIADDYSSKNFPTAHTVKSKNKKKIHSDGKVWFLLF